MSTKTISSREFNQDAGGAKKAAADGPVIITDRGRPAHVLMTFEAYRALLESGPSLYEALAPTEPDEIDFEPPRLDGPFGSPADLG